jgi:hypothetical protein
MRELDTESHQWLAAEEAPVGRWLEAMWELIKARNRHEARLAEIEKKYGPPRIGDYPDHYRYGQALKDWERRESETYWKERAEASSQYVGKVRLLTGPEEGIAPSWAIEPKEKLDEIDAARMSFLDEIRLLQTDKERALEQMKWLEERARQGKP